MRRVNSVLAMLIAALFFVHAALGGFQLMGVLPKNTLMKVISEIMMTLIAGHVLFSIKLTADTVIALKRSGAGYFRENKLFWIRRISGFALMFFIISHLNIFGKDNGSPARLQPFGAPELISQILLALTLALHIISNIKPLMLSLGLKSFKELAIDAMLIAAVILLFAGAGFLVYFIRWA